MDKVVETDIAIIGGGIAGLWLLNRLRQIGYNCILLESKTLGGGQTGKSQGIIHGGMKYNLQGKLTQAAQSVGDMPLIWKACLEGKGDIDLTHVPILSSHQYLWSTDKIRGKISGFFASHLLKEKILELTPDFYPDVFKNSQFKGQVYSLDEIVIDVPTLIRELVKPNQDVIFKTNPFDANTFHFDENNRLRALKIVSPIEEVVTVKARKFIFTSGEDNEYLLNQLREEKLAMQRRPLHMVMVKTDLMHPVYAHCLGFGTIPRITITTHQTHDKKTVWYLGGQIAEEGIHRTGDEQIQCAKKELKILFPWLDFSSAQFASFRIDRAEPQQPGGKRPDKVFAKEIDNIIVAWPTKLAMAPKLAEEIITLLKDSNFTSGAMDTRHLRAWPMPPLAKPIWDDFFA